jgi:lipopolysaccharide export system permease protein
MLGSYAGPFLVTFFIAVFVLLMQFVWLYIDDLVGKGLEWYIIGEFLFYTSVTLVPMALPLAILLSSLMTFGNLAEHYELVAFKSAGISLRKVMMPLILVACLTSMAAFMFSNNILPWAKLKMGSMLYDIRNKKPAIDIRPGFFYYGIQNYVVRAQSKSEDGKSLYNLMLYDHTKHDGNTKIILAKEAQIISDQSKGYLTMTLFDGYSYDEAASNNKDNQKEAYPLTRSNFKEYAIRFDISPFKIERTDEGLFKDNYQMLNMGQLLKNSDSLEQKLQVRYQEMANNLRNNFAYLNPHRQEMKPKFVPKEKVLNSNILLNFPFKDREKILEAASSLAKSNMTYIESNKDDFDGRIRLINKHYIELHRKFTLSFACLVLFFIGAPLGAIIKKGGLGLPIVVSTIIFIFFHIISISMEKTVKEGGADPIWGMWTPTLIFLPIGIFLTIKATTDSALFDIDSYLNPFKRLIGRKTN